MNQYLLGVDGGNSKTAALLSDLSGNLLGYGLAGPGNYEAVGLEAAKENIRAAAERAMAQRKISGESVSLACFGLAGADFPEDFEMLRAAMEQLGLARSVIIENDAIIGMRAGSRRGYGAAVVMGAGAKAVGRAPDGTEVRLPGEGYEFGDWGGGGAVASEILHRVFRAYDGRGAPTMLLEMVLKQLGVADMEELTRKLYRGEFHSAQRLSLAPLAFQAAARGDRVAAEIVQRIGEEAAISAAAVLRRLNLLDRPAEVVLIGGLFKGEGPLLMQALRSRLAEEAPLAVPVLLQHEPVVGAVLLAMDQLGLDTGPALMTRVFKSEAELLAAHSGSAGAR